MNEESNTIRELQAKLADVTNKRDSLGAKLICADARIDELEDEVEELTIKGAMQFEAFTGFLRAVEMEMEIIVKTRGGVANGDELNRHAAQCRATINSGQPGWLASRDARMKAEGMAYVWDAIASVGKKEENEMAFIGWRFAEEKASQARKIGGLSK